MQEVLDRIEQWLADDGSVAIATVVEIAGSGPRELGAVMACSLSGEVAGSVSGGCVEAAVIEEAMAVLAGNSPKLLSYGVSDELGLDVGLSCGGRIEIFVDRLDRSIDPVLQAIRLARHQQKPLALCTLVSGLNVSAKMAVPGDPNQLVIGSLGNDQLDRVVTGDARSLLDRELTELRRYGTLGQRDIAEVAVFIESMAPPPHLIVFGAIDYSRALCQLGKVLGYRVTVCDARSRFATKARFTDADEVAVEWPHLYLEKTDINKRTMIVVLTHDPKFDIPALMAAVRTPAGYIGAMGSRRTHASRVQRLLEAGMSAAEMARISAPTGLDIGPMTPEETAISIFAEAIALRSGRHGGRLTGGNNPIHPRA